MARRRGPSGCLRRCRLAARTVPGINWSADGKCPGQACGGDTLQTILRFSGVISTYLVERYSDSSVKEWFIQKFQVVHATIDMKLPNKTGLHNCHVSARMFSRQHVFPSAQLLLSRSNTLLSHSCLIHSATASSSNPSNFQLINNSALKAYQERTKNDLVLRPLTTQLQTYDSPSFVFAVLREQVQAILF